MAKSPVKFIDECWQKAGLSPEFEVIRSPEIGSVMVRGRMGGTGDAFNLGEMTVTRASVKLSCGTVGHGYIMGRSKRTATRVALCDALLQTGDKQQVKDNIIQPLILLKKESDQRILAKAAATKVDFFTLARGED
jgi:alpha-D-ribose 1-methylphosphonate 5-triphosphate synthase subunit PhnG